jgi:hypothetical protein
MPLTDEETENKCLEFYNRGQTDFKTRLVAVLETIKAKRGGSFPVPLDEIIGNVKNLNNLKPETEVSDG